MPLKKSKNPKRSRRKSPKRSKRKSPKHSKRKSPIKKRKSKSRRKTIDGGKKGEYDIESLPYKKRYEEDEMHFKKALLKRYTYEKIVSSDINLILYRCLRTNELPYILDKGLLPPCTPCPDVGECCDISPGAHINSGTKAVLKSRYISASEKESVGHWCSNTSGNPTDLKSATYVKFMVKYDKVNVINPQTDIEKLGVMARNAAKASSEILIKDNVPSSNFLEIYRIKNITKGFFTSLPDNFTFDGIEFKKIIGKGKGNKITYHLSMKIWSSEKRIDFDIVYGKWPEIESFF